MPVTRSRSSGRGERKLVLRAAALVGLSAGLWATAMGGCGARTPLDAGPPQPPCFVDSDCPDAADLCNPVYCDLAAGFEAGVSRNGGLCKKLEPIDCEDNDPCTLDACNKKTGLCTYEIATRDNDGDGFRGPRPGTLPGDPDSCGDDCDDKSELAYPGGTEVCDGVDNDCNGVVDDGATYVPLLNDPIRLSGNDSTPAGPGGLAWSGTSYAAAYTATAQGFQVRTTMLDPTGQPIPPGESPVVIVNGDNAGGPLVWVGDRYGLAWQDRRSGDYEIYFTLLDEAGAKVIPDTRLTFADGFSINLSLTWTGGEFVVVWQDERDGFFDLFGQRLSLDGAPIGSNVKMTQASFVGNEAPTAAAGLETIGVAWSPGDALQHFIKFQVFNQDLSPRGEPIDLTDGATDAVYPTIVWNKDRYVVAWFDKSASPKAIYAAVIAEDGTVLVPRKAVSNPGSFRSRYPNIKALGDRLLLVYSDDRDQNDGYELYSAMLTNELEPVGPAQRVTFGKRDSIYPISAFGPDGNVGILFRDDREGQQHVFFTRLGCIVPP